MPQGHESSRERHHYTLGAAIPLHWKATMGVEGDMHAGPMYRLAAALAKAAPV
jgi:hypothetical protein